jgi:hypothetical protein
MSLCIEAAKSGRSKCGKCKATIDAGDLRVGRPAMFGKNHGFIWYHEECVGLASEERATGVATPKPDSGRAGVYVLRLNGADGKGDHYYVGKSTNVNRRVAQHIDGTGSAAWVDLHRGVAGVEEPRTKRQELASWEQQETIAQVMLHGFDRVRGWEWTFCGPWTRDDYAAFRTCAIGNGDLCRKCGHHGHMARECASCRAPWLVQCNIEGPSVGNGICRVVDCLIRACFPIHCRRCGRNSHVEAQCFARRHLNGRPLNPK